MPKLQRNHMGITVFKLPVHAIVWHVCVWISTPKFFHFHSTFQKMKLRGAKTQKNYAHYLRTLLSVCSVPQKDNFQYEKWKESIYSRNKRSLCYYTSISYLYEHAHSRVVIADYGDLLIVSAVIWLKHLSTGVEVKLLRKRPCCRTFDEERYGNISHIFVCLKGERIMKCGSHHTVAWHTRRKPMPFAGELTQLSLSVCLRNGTHNNSHWRFHRMNV